MQQGIWNLGPLARAMANAEAPGQGPFFKVLNPWIENAPQVSVIEDAKEWFVIGGNKEVRASKGEDKECFKPQ